MDVTTKNKKRFSIEEKHQLPRRLEILQPPGNGNKRKDAFHKTNELFGFLMENCNPYSMRYGEESKFVRTQREMEAFPNVRRYAEVLTTILLPVESHWSNPLLSTARGDFQRCVSHERVLGLLSATGV